jgi:hypothetical protein
MILCYFIVLRVYFLVFSNELSWFSCFSFFSFVCMTPFCVDIYFCVVPARGFGVDSFFIKRNRKYPYEDCKPLIWIDLVFDT